MFLDGQESLDFLLHDFAVIGDFHDERSFWLFYVHTLVDLAAGATVDESSDQVPLAEEVALDVRSDGLNRVSMLVGII